MTKSRFKIDGRRIISAECVKLERSGALMFLNGVGEYAELDEVELVLMLAPGNWAEVVQLED